MTWPLRIEYEDAYSHVMNRGRGGSWISTSEQYKNIEVRPYISHCVKCKA